MEKLLQWDMYVENFTHCKDALWFRLATNFIVQTLLYFKHDPQIRFISADSATLPKTYALSSLHVKSGLKLTCLPSLRTLAGILWSRLSTKCQKNMLHSCLWFSINHWFSQIIYGPPYGLSRITFWANVAKSLHLLFVQRLLISSKAGYDLCGAGPFWPRPASRRILSCQSWSSLKRTGLDYFRYFYSHGFLTLHTLRRKPCRPLDYIVLQDAASVRGVYQIYFYNKPNQKAIGHIEKGPGTPLFGGISRAYHICYDRWIEMA